MARSFKPQEAAASDPFAPIPVGTYAFRVTDLEIREGAKDDYLNVTVGVLAGPFQTHPVGVKSPFAERKVWDILSYSPNAQARLGQAFIAVGHPHPPNDLDDIGEMRNDVFEGRVFLSDVYHEDYKGEPKAKLKAWKPAPPEVLRVFPHCPPVASSGGGALGGPGPDDFGAPSGGFGVPSGGFDPSKDKLPF